RLDLVLAEVELPAESAAGIVPIAVLVAVAIADRGDAAGAEHQGDEDVANPHGELRVCRDRPDASMAAKKEPRRSGALPPVGMDRVYLVELGPFIVPPPLAPDDVPELCGAELLPDELSQPIAVFSLLLLMPLLLLVPLLLPGLLAAEPLLPGGQSLLDRPRDVPEVAPALLPVMPLPLVPALVPDLPLVVPVLLVCAIAAVPKVSAMIETAVRRRRFIRCPPFEKRRPVGRKALEARVR